MNFYVLYFLESIFVCAFDLFMLISGYFVCGSKKRSLNLGVNIVINRLAKGVFTVFLLHGVFLPYLQIEKFVTGNTLMMLLHMFISVVLIYVVCWGVYIVYHKITEPIYKALSSKIKLPLIDAET